ncbi:trypsin-like serine peptidase [Streptomyces sp. NPDC002845]
MRRIRRALLPSLAATLLILGIAEPASAQQAEKRTTASDSATTTAAARLSGDAARIASSDPAETLDEYWTPKRMANAIPADELAPGAADAADAMNAAEQQVPTGTPGSTSPAAPVAGEDGVSAALVETQVVGKVFFTNPSDGRNYTCSASALNSPSKQMVITAGHCVNVGGQNGTAGQWMTNWTYVPRYRDGARPFGTFAAKEYRAFNGWINNSSFQWDVAMVTTWPRSGDKVVNVTGGHGLSWNYNRSQAVTVWGYPGNRDNGQIQWWCTGTTRQVSSSDGRIELQCDFGGGSSGGPWLREYNDSTGLGYVNGVMSTIAGGGWNRSSYFGDSVKAMFDAQGSAT